MEGLTEEQKQLAEKHHSLIYWLMTKQHLPYDDYYGVVAYGLCKAAKTFDPTRGILFTTYAIRLMLNEINMERRREHNYKRVEATVSLSDAIEDTDRLTIQDMIPDNTVDLFSETVASCMLDLIEQLEGRDRQIVLLAIQGYTQSQIAQQVHIAQSYVSRILRRVYNDIQNLQASIPKRKKAHYGNNY